jgi:hypothetical protein
MVANAHKELREWCAANGGDHIFAAKRDGPGGIVDALHHFGWGAGCAALAYPLSSLSSPPAQHLCWPGRTVRLLPRLLVVLCCAH